MDDRNLKEQIRSLAKRLPRTGEQLARFKVEEVVHELNAQTAILKLLNVAPVQTFNRSVKQMINDLDSIRRSMWRYLYKEDR